MAISTVHIGWAGEKNARTVSLPIGDYLTEWPDSTITILFTRPGEEEASVVTNLTVSGTSLLWRPSKYDCGKEGRGTANIAFANSDGDYVGYSNRFGVVVNNSVMPGTSVPQTMAEYAGQILLAADAAKNAAAKVDAAEETVNTAVQQANAAASTLDDKITEAGEMIANVSSATETIDAATQQALTSISEQEEASKRSVNSAGTEAKQTALSGILEQMRTAKNAYIQDMENIQDDLEEELEAIAADDKTAMNSYKQSAVEAIDAKKETAVNAVNLMTTNSVSSVQNAELSAVTAVNTAKSSAVSSVVAQRSASINAVKDQETTSINAVRDAGASITKLKEDYVIASDNKPSSTYNEVWFDTSDEDVAVIPEIDDTEASTENTYSSSKIDAIIAELDARLKALEAT